MDRNFIIAMVLMVAVLFVWQAFFMPKPEEPMPGDEVAGDSPTPEAETTPAETPTAVTPGLAPPAPQSKELTPEVHASIKEEAGRRIYKAHLLIDGKPSAAEARTALLKQFETARTELSRAAGRPVEIVIYLQDKNTTDWQANYLTRYAMLEANLAVSGEPKISLDESVLETPVLPTATAAASGEETTGPQPDLLLQEITVNGLVTGVLSNEQGGTLRRWNLLDYDATTEDKELPPAEREKVNLVPYDRPLHKDNVRNPDRMDKQPQLICGLGNIKGLDGSGNWQQVELSDGRWTVEKTLGDLTVRKTLRWNPQGEIPEDLPYNVDVELAVINRTGQAVEVEPFCATYEQVVEQKPGSCIEGMFARDYNIMMQLTYSLQKDLESALIAKGDKIKVPEGPIYWIGFADNYFATLIGPDQKTIKLDDATASLAVIGPNKDLMEARLLVNKQVVQPNEAGAPAVFVFKAYLGPKKRTFISAGENSAAFHFDKSINFGWFDSIAQVLVWALIKFYNLFKNWGVAILIVTVIIKALMFPLQHKSYKSMKAMTRLQPEIVKLREQFKDNKEKLNQEMMALYKAHKVNPAGGCLPMLLQLPIFIAFYRALGYTIELRHAHFAWWLQDLSAPDPYYITPLLMGASMFLSQKMTPSTADPAQQRVMMIMPIVFTFMFLGFPSGLVLYWLTNNILSIVQQVATNKYFSDNPPPAPAKAGGKQK